jgi:hypothetical protein
MEHLKLDWILGCDLGHSIVECKSICSLLANVEIITELNKSSAEKPSLK